MNLNVLPTTTKVALFRYKTPRRLYYKNEIMVFKTIKLLCKYKIIIIINYGH